MTEEASRLSLQFSQNLRKATKAFKLHLTDEADLSGLPETVREAAATAAREEGKEGWIITLDAPSYGPFMMYADRRDLRQQVFMAHGTLCTEGEECNLDICKRLVNLRRELAQLLGLRDLRRLRDGISHGLLGPERLPLARRPHRGLQAHGRPGARRGRGPTQELEGDDFDFQPWDTAYYSFKLQMRRYNLDPEMLRPYFEVKNVIKGVFGLATRLYGITFRENKEIPVYHPDVRPYEVYDRDGSYLTVLFVDFYPRKGQARRRLDDGVPGPVDREGRHQRAPPRLAGDEPQQAHRRPTRPAAPLGEVETFLHEFGHALHGMFANTRFESLSGTNVWWDFVELPSQFMENYATGATFSAPSPSTTRRASPSPTTSSTASARAATTMWPRPACARVSFGLLDMAYYTQKDPFEADIIPFEKAALQKAIIGQQLPQTCMTTQFSHIMAGGYAAGYYSYKWAEVLETDAFGAFQEHGIFDQGHGATLPRLRALQGRHGAPHDALQALPAATSRPSTPCCAATASRSNNIPPMPRDHFPAQSERFPKYRQRKSKTR